MRVASRWFLLATFTAWCWLAMMAVHEMGHVLAAMATGGSVTHVVWHPLAISRTDVSPNPSPGVVAWAGPVVGSLLPLLLWIGARRGSVATRLGAQFFAGFCLLANGVYVGAGASRGIGDAGPMLQSGTPAWTLGCFAALTTGGGLLLWHGLGPRLGLDRLDDRQIAISSALSLALLAMTLAGSLAWTALG